MFMIKNNILIKLTKLNIQNLNFHKIVNNNKILKHMNKKI